MHPIALRILLRVLWPGLVPVLGVLIWLGMGEDTGDVAGSLQGLRYGALALAGLLGWRFHRSRVLFAALTLSLGAEALFAFGAETGSPVAEAVLVAGSVNLAFLALVGDRGLWSVAGVVTWLLLIVEAGWLLFLGGAEAHQAPDWLMSDVIAFPLGQLSLTMSASTVAGLGSGLVLLLCLSRREGPVDSGLLGALVALFVALAHPIHGATSYGLITTALGVLVLSVLETTYALAYRDELTGLPSRRALNQLLDRIAPPYTLAMVDIDHFKKLNDTHGHDAGDHVLRMVAFKLAAVGGGGKAFRYGGEEFTVVFPHSPLGDTVAPLEELREAIAGHNFVVRSSTRPRQKPAGSGKKKDKDKAPKRQTVQVTVSIGAAQVSDALPDPEQVLKAADKKLYDAKQAGRNQLKS